MGDLSPAFGLGLPAHAAAVTILPPPDVQNATDGLGRVQTTEELGKHFHHAKDVVNRADTALEQWRRACFAQRNVEHSMYSPDVLAYVPTTVAHPEQLETYTPQRALQRIRSHRRRQKLYYAHAGATDASDKGGSKRRSSSLSLALSTFEMEDEDIEKMPEAVRARVWPPEDLTSKSLQQKGVRNRGVYNTSISGRKKAGPVFVDDRFPLQAKKCHKCGTQSSALWRQRALKPTKTKTEDTKPPLNEVMADYCLKCYLTLERTDLFAKKKKDLAKRKRQTRDRAYRERKKQQVKQETVEAPVGPPAEPEGDLVIRFKRPEASDSKKEKKKKKKKHKKKHKRREEEALKEEFSDVGRKRAASLSSSPSSKKRKVDSSRDRELRQLGQYCPVCDMTYEADDQSSFVCCDACELWVHSTCDLSLTPERIAELSTTDQKYICPACSNAATL